MSIIQLDASVTIYAANEQFLTVAVLFVQPLTDAPSNSNPFDAMAVTVNQSSSYSVRLAVQDAHTLHAGVYASAHGCGEFCGGGVHREIQLFIDGSFAESAIPFPVVYTGGMNPFLWRPLTGIMSFDIPPHRLDITPFLAVLAHGGEHIISFSDLNNDISGCETHVYQD